MPGVTIEVTALTRIGRPGALHALPPVFVAIAIHFATSGSVQGLEAAWEQAEANGVTGRLAGTRAAMPFLTTDMAYNSKSRYAELVLHHGYSPVARYPQGWGIQIPSIKPSGLPESVPDPGPLQYAGAFYCPAVRAHIQGHGTPDTASLLKKDRYRSHDNRLRKILPYLMGYNSRPAFAGIGHGRPTIGVGRR